MSIRSLALLALFAASAAPAQQAPCDLTASKALTQILTPPVAIPDNNPGGVVVGPQVSNLHPQDRISKTILEIGFDHTWVGDLQVRLDYDVGCDGSSDAFAVVLCRPRANNAATPAPCGTGVGFGCSGDLVCQNHYLFDDASSTQLGVGSTCPMTMPGGCYRPPVDGGAPLTAFYGLPKNGCWYLKVVDTSAGDVGSICYWTVWEDKTPPVGVAAVPWGRVKTLYR